VFKGGREKGKRKGEEKGEREPGASNGVPKKLAGGYYTGLAVVKCLNIFLLHSAFCAVDHCGVSRLPVTSRLHITSSFHKRDNFKDIVSRIFVKCPQFSL
jgi:hypothetical protein